jgi:protein-L-isoaspartate(D-aspartate) O-methyltransferase
MRLLTELGYGNVHVRIGDGRLGWPEEAPFDAILATAAPLDVPPALLEQLAPGGRMVIPVGKDVQDLRLLRKPAGGGPPEVASLMPVRFVPMTSSEPGTPADPGIPSES